MTAKEVRRFKWVFMGFSVLALFAFGHWIAGIIGLLLMKSEVHEEPDLT
jgi:hypothetical protein